MLGLILFVGILVSYPLSAKKVYPVDTYLNKYVIAARDTIKPRYNDFISDTIKNPFDLRDPSVVEKKVEYDPESGMYIITEKIGNDYFRSPTYMTFEEYLKWKEKEQRKEYFSQLSGSKSGNRSKRGIVDPASYIDVKKDLVERIFGGNEITIKPQGSIHLTLGVSRQIMNNPAFERDAQRIWNPIFDEGIQVNVEGGIGDKMKLNFNYNTKASFDFDNKIKLKYDSEKFNEDAILKKIEAGNVSLPLRGNLIQGGQNLFGIKTELQFGHLKLTAIASQQRSEQKNVKIDKGAVKQEFEITPDQYDENRHFFVSHYNRDSYEDAIGSLPNVKTPFRITRIEVWVIPERNETHDLRDICALTDLGEGKIENYTNKHPYIDPNPSAHPLYFDHTGSSRILPDNKVSPFYELALKSDSITRLKTNVSFSLESKYGMKSGRDFEIFKGRKLNPSEFSYNAELGFISLNRPLQPEDVLGVSYEYTYSYNDSNGKNRADSLFRVGEFNELTDTLGKVMYVKLLKSKTQKPGLPEWDLMMKNVYYIGTSDIDRESFKLDVYYEDIDGSLKRFLPENVETTFGGVQIPIKKVPLLQVFNLDNINVVGDIQPDGIFDYIPGITVIPSIGSVIFPVLEPFGNSLDSLLKNPDLAKNYKYEGLYTESKVKAQKQLNKNKFLLKGEYKSSSSSEISLGTWNMQGNPIVTSGGKTLIEGVDYDLDKGAGKIRIINPAILQSGRPVNVRFEDNSLFNLTQKNLIGLRADYEVRKNFNVGATYMHLFERPYTEKVSYGDDPINNRIFGLDMEYSSEADWLTRAIDKLPFISTKAPSSISFKTEVAALKPGHSKAINDENEKGGIIILDDFEGSSVKLYLNTENDWTISSTPHESGTVLEPFPESKDTSLAYGANRALLSWYVAERGTDSKDPYTRSVYQTELFERDIPVGSIPDLRTFDINFYPSERGPYNFDLPDGRYFDGKKISAGVVWDDDDKKIVLKEPESRWGGLMRYLRFSDFESLNVEYIEFWMLNPFMQTNSRPNQDPDERGEMVINLGNVSEDILKDGLQFYENSLPLDGEPVPIAKTAWGKVPNDTPLDDAFPNDPAKIKQLDVGLDGLNDTEEFQHFKSYFDAIRNTYSTATFDDLANDNWVYFDAAEVKSKPLNDRYYKYNNPDGNFPDRNEEERRGKLRPDKEELNLNKSLDITESYYKYVLPIVPIDDGSGHLVLDTTDIGVRRYVTDIKEVTSKSGREELWYRFRVPINEGTAVGDIDGFRSIQFMRMYFTHFRTPKTFRLAEFGLVRNQWRKDQSCANDVGNPNILNLDVVGLEENAKKEPLGYISPPHIQRERLLANYENIRQDEKSLVLKFDGLKDSCYANVYKLTKFDARLFKKLQLFVHAESEQDLSDRQLYLYLRLGKDFTDNYYEYEIPLKMSDIAAGKSVENIWPDENFLDIILKDFTDLKLERNKNNIPLGQIYFKNDAHNTRNPGATIKIKGNPSLGYIKGVEIGLTTYQKSPIKGEVWINELRAVGLDEKGGVAATANLDVKMADLGTFNAAFNYMTIGFGALDEKLAQRSMDEVLDYDLSTSLQIGRFFPKNWGVNLPVYLQYGQTIKKPKYDAYDLDLTVDENVSAAKTTEEKNFIKDRSLDVVTVKSLNFSNISINKGDTKYPWAPSNIKMGYFYTNTNQKNPIIKNEDETDQKLTLDYAYSRGTKYIKPFKKAKPKFIKNIHFNLLPNSFSFNTQLRKYDNIREYREPVDITYKFEDNRFNWDRNYNLQWNFTKNLKMNFTAKTHAIVDEYKKWGIFDIYKDEKGVPVDNATPQVRKKYMLDNLKKFGRPQTYNHNIDLSYNLPVRNIPFLKWIKVNAKYRASYDWIGTPPFQVEEYGNMIQNQQARSVSARLDFEKLYKSVKYLKKIDDGFGKKKKKRSKSKRRSKKKSKSSKKKKKKKKEREPSTFEKIIFRPLLAFRDVKLSYKEDLGTTVPGYTKNVEYLGTTDNFTSPGLDFVAGIQSRNDSVFGTWLKNKATEGWIVTNKFFNSQFFLNKRQKFNAKIKLEPINNLKIDVEFKKSFTKNNSRVFKFDSVTSGFNSFSVLDRGMFEVTYFAVNTLFTSDYETLFNRFSEYRKTISKRQYFSRNKKKPSPDYPRHKDNADYAYGFGPQSQDVLIPSFLAAYTGVSLDKVPLDIYKDIGEISYLPRPNWRAEFNLNRFSFFKDIFSSFKITNGYKSTLKVASIQTDLNFKQDSFGIDDNEKNYYSEYIIPSMVLDERFEPVIGIDVKTKSDLSFRVDYKKSRTLLLSQKSLQQTRSEEFVFNFGYVVKNVYIPFLTKKPKKKKRGKKSKIDKELGKKSSRKSKRAKNNLRDLRISVDFSIRDNEVKEYLFDSGRKGKPTHGNYRISLSPTMEYNITDNFSLQADFSYDKTVPYVNNSYPVTNYRGTITAKYSLK